MKQNQDFIQKKFGQDGIQAPDSLSEERLLEILPEQKDTAFRTGSMGSERIAEEIPESDWKTGRRKKRARRILAAAACLMVAVIAGPRIADVVMAPPDTSLVNGELYTFQDTKEIRNLVRELDRSGNWATGADSLFRDEAVLMEEAIAPEGIGADSDMTIDSIASARSENATASAASTGSHSSTYRQVEDVDEADIVKTDGKYIYYVNRKSEVLIYSAVDGQTEKVAEIGNGQIDNYIHDLYLKGDLLITVGVVYEDGQQSSAVVTYDISDRTRPERISVFRQSGDIVSSRMVGDYVYLVTSESVHKDGRVVPEVTRNGSYGEMPVRDICAVPDPVSPSYVILSSFDTRSGENAKCQSKAVFGASEEIYCNTRNLYTAVTEYDQERGESGTRIVRASLDGKKIRFEATGKVSGRIDNQFSMDEKDDYLRVATTSRRDGMDVNNLYVLDQELREVGNVTGFARDESIRAVRYLGEKAYVITFEQVDPLFVIDLSDPTSPRIEGEVEIEGFSSLLVPVREGRMLGIGYLTRDNGYGGVFTDGLKLALFDVSDPSHPAVLDSEEFPGMTSPAQSDHHALVMNSAEDYCAIPYGNPGSRAGWIVEDDIAPDEEVAEGLPDETAETADERGGVLVFRAGDQIQILDRHPLDAEQLRRSVYIGDWIYALDEQGAVYSFSYR